MITIITNFIICWAFKDLFQFIGEIVMDFQFRNKSLQLIKSLLAYILTCNKCSSMWFSLILTGNILYAAIISISINYLSQLEYKYKKTEL